jgi:protein TonB
MFANPTVLHAALSTLRLVLPALVLAAGSAFATTDDLRAELARRIYLSSATDVHDEQPQAMLRAVVMLRVRLDEQGRWTAEVVRENPQQPAMTRRALESVARLPAPIGLSVEALRRLRAEGVVEAWLFDDDGRFALGALARPQRRA